MRRVLLSSLVASTLATSAAAQDAFLIEQFGLLGFGRMFTNDAYGDGKDRWHTGSYTFSIVTGDEWNGVLPDKIGEIVEYRLRSDIIAPSTLSGAGSNDRPYVGALSAGIHTHYQLDGYEISVGADVTAVGPQTRLASFQTQIHKLLKLPTLGQNVIDNQVQNAFHLTGVLDVARSFQVSQSVKLRPFFEGRVGIEDTSRVGFDVIVGTASNRDLMLRDTLSGQLYKGIEYGDKGWTFLAGADVAYTTDSAYFPASFGTVAKKVTYRARAGVEYQWNERAAIYYGATYLSPEYVGQTEGQVVGALRITFNF